MNLPLKNRSFLLLFLNPLQLSFYSCNECIKNLLSCKLQNIQTNFKIYALVNMHLRYRYGLLRLVRSHLMTWLSGSKTKSTSFPTTVRHGSLAQGAAMVLQPKAVNNKTNTIDDVDRLSGRILMPTDLVETLSVLQNL